MDQAFHGMMRRYLEQAVAGEDVYDPRDDSFLVTLLLPDGKEINGDFTEAELRCYLGLRASFDTLHGEWIGWLGEDASAGPFLRVERDSSGVPVSELWSYEHNARYRETHGDDYCSPNHILRRVGGEYRAYIREMREHDRLPGPAGTPRMLPLEITGR